MWDAGSGWSLIVGGTHEVFTSAVARYEGASTELRVVSCSVSSSFDAGMVRTSMQLVVADPDGTLTPRSAGDPLAPYGQTVDVRMSLGAAGVVTEVPIGEFVIMDATPEGGSVPYRASWIPAGGTVSLQLADLVQQIVDADIVGLMQPRAGATVGSELTRLCGKQVPVDVSNVPAMSLPVRGVVYDESRIEAAQSLAALTGLVLGMDRTGALALLDPEPSATVLDVTVAAGRWVDASMELSRDDIFNVVIAEGEAATDDRDAPYGIAQETVGPFRVGGPLGPRVYRMASPLISTNLAAMRAAATRLRNLQALRQLTFSAHATFDPTIDVLDLHRVTIDPGPRALDVTALVVGIEYSTAGGEMTVKYSTPRAEVELWEL